MELHNQIVVCRDPIYLAKLLGQYMALAVSKPGTAPALRNMSTAGSELRLTNLEIQRLMSDYNQSETLASSMLKKRDDASGSVVAKI